MRPKRPILVVLALSALIAVLTAVVAQQALADDSVEGYFSWTRLNPQRNFIPSAHATPKDIYVNDVGAESATSRSFPFPEGSVLVKEVVDEASLSVAMLPSMRKVAGFDPDNNDWQYAMFVRQDDGSFAGEWVGTDHEMHAMCSSCHAGAAESDYAFLNYTGN
ncbi:hypothetical protein BH23DEI1_BH23DEI1_03970 [soil metagenome]|nr:cytochrome P460 family protein [Trueperaceae bacterium]